MQNRTWDVGLTVKKNTIVPPTPRPNRAPWLVQRLNLEMGYHAKNKHISKLLFSVTNLKGKHEETI